MEIWNKHLRRLRVALGARLLMTKKNSTRSGITMAEVDFEIGEVYHCNADAGFYLADDTSLMYRHAGEGDYSILLGGNWRYELMINSATGRCVGFQSLLGALQVLRRSLTVPKAQARSVFVKGGELLPGEGSHYHPFDDKAYWDEAQSILCIGEPDAQGEAVEFAPQITMIIKDRRAVCLYLSLGHLTGIDFGL